LDFEISILDLKIRNKPISGFPLKSLYRNRFTEGSAIQKRKLRILAGAVTSRFQRGFGTGSAAEETSSHRCSPARLIG